VGAAYVRWPDGRRSVLSEGRTRTGPLLDLARAAGVPTARQELSAHIDGVRVIVQQRLPGAPPTTVDASLVHQMVDLNDRLAGLLAGPRDEAPDDRRRDRRTGLATRRRLDRSGPPETSRPGSGPDDSRPGSGILDDSRPDRELPDDNRPSRGFPDGSRSDRGRPDDSRPNRGRPDDSRPDSGLPADGHSGSGLPDGSRPGSGPPAGSSADRGGPADARPADDTGPDGSRPDRGGPDRSGPEAGALTFRGRPADGGRRAARADDDRGPWRDQRGGERRAGIPSAPPVELYLNDDGPGFCLHGPLAAHSRRTARLLAWVHEVGAAGTPADGDDLVHLDFQPGNVLVHNGRITGLIDWDGAARGDRHLDLVVLRFYLLHHAPLLTRIVDERLATAHPDRVRAYWAHISLRQVDWSIRHHDAAAVDHWLDVAELGMP
jgi:hypothetical protein